MTTSDKPEQGKFDWDTIKQRFVRLMEASSQSDTLSNEQAEVVMAERAKALAKVPDTAPNSDEILEVMIVRLATERLAIETRFIHEVYRVSDITPVPGGPTFLLGVTNMRGSVLSVLDLRTFFGIATDPEPQPQIIILGTKRQEFGMLVDEVYEVTTLRIDEVVEAPGCVHGANRDYLRGVTADAMLILDGEMLLSDERLFMDERE